jgi:hypothetical protein
MIPSKRSVQPCSVPQPRVTMVTCCLCTMQAASSKQQAASSNPQQTPQTGDKETPAVRPCRNTQKKIIHHAARLAQGSPYASPLHSAVCRPFAKQASPTHDHDQPTPSPHPHASRPSIDSADTRQPPTAEATPSPLTLNTNHSRTQSH